MKEQKWNESIDITIVLLEASAVVLDEDCEIEISSTAGKSQMTKLRRRIEERLDSKRIALEYDYDDIDDMPENLQYNALQVSNLDI